MRLRVILVACAVALATQHAYYRIRLSRLRIVAYNATSEANALRPHALRWNQELFMRRMRAEVASRPARQFTGLGDVEG